MDELITSADQVTPLWLTELLRSKGLLPRGEVADVELAEQKSTFTSAISYLAVSYSDPRPAAAPERLFLKLSRPETSPGEFDTEHFRKEIDFHNTVAPVMSDPPSVGCYSAAYCDETGRCHLLVDDLSETHYQPPAPKPPRVELCEQAIDSLADLHAAWWDHPRLGKDIGSYRTTEQRDQDIASATKLTEQFIDFLGDKLSGERRQIYMDVGQAMPNLNRRHDSRKNMTIAHGDAHLWNFLYPRDAATHKVRIIDWQFWHPTIGGTDLAFMIAREWNPDRRSRLEQPLLRRYHQRLCELGVDGFSWDDCWCDYRLSVILVSIFIPVWQWGLFKVGPDSWWSGLEKAMLAYEDLNCAELLS